MLSPVDPTILSPLYATHIATLGERYGVLLERHSLDAVVLHTGSPQKRSVFDDQYWPLIVVPHTRHWLPLEVADCAVVIRAGQKPQLLLNVHRDFWEGETESDGDHFWSAFDVVEVQGADAVAEHLPRGRRAFIGEDRPRALAWGFNDAEIAPPKLMNDLDALRAQKSEYEIVCLREANRRACLGHNAVLRAFHDGEHSELDLHLLYLQATAQDDPETPYKNIVALGEHAATLHHVSYGRQKVAAQSLLLDAGASFCGYDSDITRTSVKGTGALADTFRALVAGVESLHLELCRRAKPGVRYEQLHDQSHELLAEVLRDVKIAKASASALVDSGATRKLFPHGLGHSLGIQTHDVGCRSIAPAAKNPFLRNTATVAAGQVFTIEPGCYFIPSLLDDLRQLPVAAEIDWQLVEGLIPFGGVRIEDDLGVTAAGLENMTRAHLTS